VPLASTPNHPVAVLMRTQRELKAGANRPA
jgi:hypothetical protein